MCVAVTVLAFAASLSLADVNHCGAHDLDGGLLPQAKNVHRFATFNVFLNRASEGELMADLASAEDQLGLGGSDAQSRAIAEIIQRVRPDVLLLNEFDYDEAGIGITWFKQNFLEVSQGGAESIVYPYVYNRPSNTGIDSGMDLDHSGSVGSPGDAIGYGFFPGQFGMVLLSKFPILEDKARTFARFLWKDMPGALLPDDVQTTEPNDFYDASQLNVLRLSSKSHWDVPVLVGETVVHVLAAHPTPPVFDGPEDRNGRRNHDEIRLWADYIRGGRTSEYIKDDQGRRGGLGAQPFVILGDYNADPIDGDSHNHAILQLLNHPAIDSRGLAASEGAVEDSILEGGMNNTHQADPALDTGDFKAAGPGNLRLDYVLPSRLGISPKCGGVFWPTRADETRKLVGDGFPVVSSDHHLVWMDLEVRQGRKD